MSKQIDITLGNFYAYSKEVTKALHTLENFMNDREFKEYVKNNEKEMKKAKIPLSFYQYLTELEEIY
jgi:hypothetical protein